MGSGFPAPSMSPWLVSQGGEQLRDRLYAAAFCWESTKGVISDKGVLKMKPDVKNNLQA